MNKKQEPTATPFTARPQWARCITFDGLPGGPVTVKVLGDETLAKASRDALLTVLGAHGIHVDAPAKKGVA